MTINREKFETEIRAAGVTLKGLCDSGPSEGRAVLSDGTIVPGATGALGHDAGGTPNTSAAAAYRSALSAHDPTPTAAQALAGRQESGGGLLGALAVCLRDTYALAPTWARDMVDAAAGRARSA